ncbi:hypothetical protein BCR39DRAFT_589482 [Naematelia encephala]|uniref:SnoaL-like domain-containing protein n=1 Tax=Naematelia encephala TaxID=71784 RepID=A0A1Y2AVY5_9TREE|nr:hypothetical protein BCR39DRAFT_589482 [Naematelia encephala]
MRSTCSSDKNAVVQGIQQGYIDGLREGSVSQVETTFHKDAIMYGWISGGGPLIAGPAREALGGFVRQHGPAPNVATRINILDITPTTAVVKVEMENDATGSNYTEFHSLFKNGEKWEVISKVFHMY